MKLLLVSLGFVLAGAVCVRLDLLFGSVMVALGTVGTLAAIARGKA